jgi:hypothetical protein
VAQAALERGLRVREASFEDYDEIAGLETRNGLRSQLLEEWRHLWLNNPAYKALSHWPIGWVLEDEAGDVVGFFGNIPLLYEFEGQPLLATSGRSWAVDPKYRGYAILLLDYFLNQKNVDLYLNATANAEASAAFTIFQASRVPVGKWDESIFWITNYKGFVRSSLLMKSARMPEFASYPASAALSLLDRAIGRNRREIPSGTDVYPAEIFDERFDAFWERLRRRTRRLLPVRTREVLNWHFRYALERNELLILTAGRGSSMDGYGIFGRQDNEKFGLKRMRLVDFQCLSEDTIIFRLMLTRALEHCADNGVHMLELTGLRPDRVAAVQSLSPRRRQLNAWRYLYKAGDPHLTEILKDPAVWDPTCYDGDASL